MSNPRSVGKEHVTLEALRFLGLDEKFKRLDFNRPQAAAAIGTIIGRACEPESELATHEWLQEGSGHLFITLLAYHIVHTIRFRLKQADVHSS